MANPNRHTWFYAAVVALLLAAFAVRIYQLDAVALRGDEAFSVVNWTRTPFSEGWWDLWRTEPHPAGAFLMYLTWTEITGTSEFALRMLAVLAGAVNVATLVVLVRRLSGGMPLALLAGGLWTLHPFLIWHAQDARTYSVMMALLLVAFYWFIRALDASGRPFWRVWGPYIAAQALAVHIFYLMPLWLAAQGLYVLVAARHRLRDAVLAWVVIGVLSLPVIAQMYQLTFVTEYSGMTATVEFNDVFRFVLPTLFFGENYVPLLVGVVAAVLLLAGIATYGGRYRGLLLAWIIVPVVLWLAISMRTALFDPRYVIGIAPALLAGGVIALYGLTRRFSPRHAVALTGLLLLPVAGVMAVETRDYFCCDPPKAPDWYALAGYLHERLGPDDVLFTASSDPALEYYFPDTAIQYILPETPDTPDIFAGLLRDYDAVYMLSGPATGPAGRYFQTNAQPIPGDTYPGVVQFRAWNVQPDEIAVPLDVRFGDVAALRGYTVLGDETLILYWEALAQTETPHSVLLHLETSPDAPPQAVLDHGIAGAIVSTQTWEPGIIYRDPVALPVELPPGGYTIRVGMYPSGTDDRLSTPEGETRSVVGTLQATAD